MDDSDLDVCVVSSFPPTRGGIADYTDNLTRELSGIRGDIHILAYGSTNEVIEPGRNVRRIPRDAWMLPRRVARSIYELDPDVLHVQSTMFLHPRRFFLFPQFLDEQPPTVVTAHEVPGRRQFHMLPFQRLFYERSDAVVVHTDGMVDRVVDGGFARESGVSVIPHGAPVDRFDPDATPASPPRILFFGFIRPGKGVEILIEAFERLKEDGSDAELVLAGGLASETKRYLFGLRSTADYRSKIERRVASSPWSEYITLTGYVKDSEVQEYFEDATVVVFPYPGSAQSGPLHQALAAGRPIVAHDVGGFSEILSDGDTGLLYQSNTPARLAAVLSTVLEDCQVRCELGRYARKKAEIVAWSHVARETVNLYQSVINNEYSTEQLNG